MAGADLLFEPATGFLFAVAEEDGAGGDLADEMKEFIAGGGGGEVEVLDFAAAGDFAGAGAEHERFAWFGALEPAPGGVGVCVTDKEDGLALVPDHARGEVMGGGVFAHHAGGDDEDAAAREAHFLGLAGFEHGEVEGLGELAVAVVSMSAVGFGVVDFSEHAA